MSAKIRPNVLQMEPYSPGKPISEVKRELGLDRVIKLASNENPFGPSPRAIEAVKEAALSMHIYPDGAAYELKQAIASKFSVSADQVMVGNGSDELIHLLGLLFLGGEQDELLTGDPTFSRYDAAAYLAPSKLVKVPLDEHYRFDLNTLAAAITPNTRMVWIANPNNPTGTIVRKKEFEAFLDAIPADLPVVLDEAYFEFAQHVPDYPVSLDYIRQGRNVIGLRTFSKAFGLAGIRVGFGFAPHWVIDAIDRAREPFNVNCLAQAAGIAALGDDEHVKRTLDNNRKGVEAFNEAFRKVGARPMESFANFVYADLGRPARPVFDQLLRRGVITRPGDVLGNPNCLRVSVGSEEENAIFIHEFLTIMQAGEVTA